MLETPTDVARALRALRDETPMRSGSVLRVPSGGPDHFADPWRRGYLTAFEMRRELARRMMRLDDREREVVLLWYAADLPVRDICTRLGLSRSHAYRVRDRALRRMAGARRPALTA